MTPSEETLAASREEWEAWQVVTHALIAAGAVTQADLGSFVGQVATPGQRLLGDIREWGDALAALAVADVVDRVTAPLGGR